MLNNVRLSYPYNFTEPRYHVFDRQTQLREESQGLELALVDVAELSNWRQVQYRCLYLEHTLTLWIHCLRTLKGDVPPFVCHMAVLWHLGPPQSVGRARGCGSLQSVLALEVHHDTT